MARLVNHAQHKLAALTKRLQAERKQDGKKQNLQNFTLRESTNNCI
jgi:hypothetical protein